MSLKNGSIAIYRQIIEYFEYEIASGRLSEGSRIDSIRDLALHFKVNPNTIQKALSELERDGLIYTDRTNGKFVVDDVDRLKDLRHEIGRRMGMSFVEKSKALELTLEETLGLVENIWRQNNE